MSDRRRLLGLLRVQPGEEERVALLLLLSLVLVGGVVITGLVVGRSLFLSGLPASAIPLRFIVPPILLVAATAAYSRHISRRGQVRALVPTFVAMAAAVLVARLLVDTPLGQTRLFLLLLYALFEITAGLAMILFWTLAGSVFDPRQARRLFGLVSSGSGIAMVAFGLFLGGLARRTSPESLMLLVVASLVVAATITGRLLRYIDGDEVPPAPSGSVVDEPVGRGVLAEVREALSSPLVATLAAIVLVTSLVANITDYQLDLALKDTYGGDGADMIGFLSRLRLVAGVGAIVVQFLLAGRIVKRFGLLAALLTLPLAVGTGSVAILASGAALWAVAIPRASVEALRYSVNDSAFNLLYLPLSPRARSRSKAVIDGMLKPPLVAGLGLTFLVVDRLGGVSTAAWSVPVLVLVVAWLALLRRADRTYVRALAQSIALRRLDPTHDGLAMTDEASRRLLAAELAGSDPAKVIHALSLLSAADGHDWSSEVTSLLRHPSPDVRQAALDYLGRGPHPGYADAIRPTLADPDAAVRAAAVRALGAALGSAGVGELTALLDDPCADVRATAIVALVEHGGLAGFLHAGGPLQDMLASPDPADRRAGARILGALAVPSFYHPLVELAADPDRDVRLAAVEAARRTGSRELVPALERAMADPVLRRPAVAALVTCAGDDLSLVGSLLVDPARPVELRGAVAATLGDRDPAAAPVLLTAVADPDDRVRSAVLGALVTLHEAHPTVRLPLDELGRQLELETTVAYGRWLCRLDLREAGTTTELLDEALGRAAEADRDRLLDLLALTHPELSASALRDALDRPGGRRGAEAVELVDSVAAGRSSIVPYLGGTDSERLEVAEKRLALTRQPALVRLEQLATAPDAWTRACALDLIGRHGTTALRAAVEAAAADPDPVVTATAGAALARLDQLSRSEPKESTAMPLAPLEQVLFLKQVPLFSDIAGEEIATLLAIVEQVEFAPGDVIIREGDEGDGLFVVVEGEVAITIGGEARARVGSGGVIGELAILTGDPRAATCTAVGPVLAMRIRRDPFWALMRERSEVALGVIRILLQYVSRPASSGPAPTTGPAAPETSAVAERAQPAGA